MSGGSIASAAAVLECVERTRPGAVVNCAAYTDVDGADVTDRYFRFDNCQIKTVREIMPSMLTLDRRVIQQDCLCYLMERIHFEDNEEVTTVDPLPEGIERSDYVW